MKDMEKLQVYASILKEEPNKEMALALSIPPPEQRQPDLQYFNSVFVSSGFNLNLAYFLPSELIKARNTIVNKPLDREHEQEEIVGHIYGSTFAYKDGTPFDPTELAERVGLSVDKVSMDILTSSFVYKARFPEIAADVSEGKYGVSMECYFRDYDLIVNNIIIPKIEAEKAGLVQVINDSLVAAEVVSVVEGSKEIGTHTVGRVLRGMLFSGCGLVETPANPDSIIFETASKLETAAKLDFALKHNKPTTDFILDLTKVDSYMKAKQLDEASVIYSLEGTEKDSAYISSYGGVHSHEVASEGGSTIEDGDHFHVIMPENVPEGQRVYFIGDGGHKHTVSSIMETAGKEVGHNHKFYLETRNKNGDTKVRAYETGGSKDPHTHELLGKEMSSVGGIHYHEVVLKDGTKLKTVTPQDILDMDIDSAAGKQNADDVIQKPEPEICVSFKRKVYNKGGDNPGEPSNADKTPGLIPQVESLPAPTGGGAGNTITQNDKVVHENWCALFETSCTTPAGQATHPKCLRLVLGRTTKDAVASFFNKIETERSNKNLMKKVDILQKLIEEASKLY